MTIHLHELQYLLMKKRHLHNLVALANVDGHLHEDEQKLLYELGEKYGIKEKTVRDLIEHRAEFKPHVPPHFDEKIDQLFDFMLMIMADREIHHKEVEFFKNKAKEYDFKPEVADVMLEMFQKEAPDRESWEDFKLEAHDKYYKQ